MAAGKHRPADYGKPERKRLVSGDGKEISGLGAFSQTLTV